MIYLILLCLCLILIVINAFIKLIVPNTFFLYGIYFTTHFLIFYHLKSLLWIFNWCCSLYHVKIGRKGNQKFIYLKFSMNSYVLLCQKKGCQGIYIYTYFTVLYMPFDTTWNHVSVLPRLCIYTSNTAERTPRSIGLSPDTLAVYSLGINYRIFCCVLIAHFLCS